MRRAPATAALCVAAAAVLGARGQAVPQAPARPSSTLASALDAIFSSPPLARALTAVRVDSLADGRIVYARNAGMMIVPASNLKIVTMAVAAERMGWDRRFETRLEISGSIADGALRGDLFVTGMGDPSIAAQDLDAPQLFRDWAAALRSAGIQRIEGRLIGDDDALTDEPLGAGWAWDYLSAGYAAPSGALSYNENVAIVRAGPGTALGAPAVIAIGPPGHGLELTNRVTTSAAGTTASLILDRLPGSPSLLARGQVPLGASPLVRTTAVDNPTRYFVQALRLSLLRDGIGVAGGALDIDDVPGAAPPASRRVLARHASEPLSSLIGYAMKVSQNYYGEMMLKAIGRAAGGDGSTESGRRAVRETLAQWNLPADSLVMYDGSGLSRYNYVTADLLVSVLTHAWRDERLRGPFVASLPVGGRDGTLQSRMTSPGLDRRIQAKTGTINNVRSLSGYVTTTRGEKLAFAMIANNFTAPNAEIDAIMDRALEEIVAR